MSTKTMIDTGNIKTEPKTTSPVVQVAQRRNLVGRDWMELAFILLYPILLPLPILNVVAGILSVYALLSLAARERFALALIASAFALALGSIFRIGPAPPEFNVALQVMSLAPTLALAIGFRVFSKMRSAFMLMVLVAGVTVAVVFLLGAEAISGIFDEFKELAGSDPALNATVVGRLFETLRWLTPALIAAQTLLPVLLAWYLSPTLERMITGGKSDELATSPRYYWLTLTQWRLPQYTLGLLFLFAAGRLISDSLGLEEMKRMSDNLLFASVLVFSITGFAMVEYLFRRFRVAWIMRGLFYFLALASALPGTIFLAAVGLADTQFDLRNRIPAKRAEKPKVDL
jgi:hypothetical protein